MGIHYTPPRGRAGDVIPYYANGRFHVFYLIVDDVEGVTGSSWEHISSTDLIEWTTHPTTIPRGNPDDADASPATGSVIERDGVHHAFYTGFSDARYAKGLPWQTVLRTSSTDLDTWTKDDDFVPLNADPARYDAHDWRDPFVFFNEDAGEYWMILTGQLREGPANRRGVMARYRSEDLWTWELVEPLWAPFECQALECPDLFRLGDWWYLLYSPISNRQITRYRMSRTLDGPWIAPADDALDDDGLYAAKTMSDGDRRYLVGWVPTRTPATDDGAYQWGGTLVTHEIGQREDGSLTVSTPREVRHALPAPPLDTVRPSLGEWSVTENDAQTLLAGSPGDGFGWCELGSLPETGSVTLSLECDPDVTEAGIAFRVDENLDSGYLIRVLPRLGRIQFDYFPRPAHKPHLHERPLVGRDAATLTLRLTWDGETVVVSVDDELVMSARTYRLAEHWGVFTEQGTTRFRLDHSDEGR